MRTGITRDETEAWRQEDLRAAGFDEAAARSLARTPGVDLHELLSLVDRGCPPRLAVRIASSCDDASLEPRRED